MRRRAPYGDKAKRMGYKKTSRVHPQFWTLHRASCEHLARRALVNNTQPAPIELYPNTIACRYCKPELEITTDTEKEV